MTDDVSATVVVERLGSRDYETVRADMRAFTERRDDATPDMLWLVEHSPVFTLGQAGRLEHLHATGEIPVVRTERGGQVTYHGPGQLVAYPLIDLKRRGLKVREFVSLIEETVIDTLATYNLVGLRKAGAPGVYVDRDGVLVKIAALGLKIVNGRSFHGVSLNVAMDLTPYDRIDACGFPDLKTVDLAVLTRHTTVGEVGDRLAERFVERLAAAAHWND